MPRLRLSRRGLTLAACVRRLVPGVPVLRAAEGPRAQGHLEPDRARQRLVAGARGAALEVCSFLSYVVLFRGVFIRGQTQRIGFRVSYQITMASLAATRLFATAGAGGVALTAWALRRSGMHRRAVAQRMITFMTLIYVVFLATLIIGGFGLYLGLLPGPAPFEITLIPALFATVLVALALAVSFVPGDLDRLVGRWTGTGPLGRLAGRLAAAPATLGGGIRAGLRLIGDPRAPAARGAGLVGLRHRGAVGVVPRVRRLPAGRAAHRRLLHRPARQPAAAARRHRRGRRSDDRRSVGVRRPGLARRRLGARLPRVRVLAADACPARSPTSSCAAPCAAGRPAGRPRRTPAYTL